MTRTKIFERRWMHIKEFLRNLEMIQETGCLKVFDDNHFSFDYRTQKVVRPFSLERLLLARLSIF
jgi:hypothetical protein